MFDARNVDMTGCDVIVPALLGRTDVRILLAMDQATASVLTATMLSSERTLPVSEPFARLLPQRALVRGQTVTCDGSAAASLAFALAADAAAAGSWIAAIDTPWLSAEGLIHLGVPVERIVRVDSGGDQRRWADLAAAATDGFEVIVTNPPSLTPTMERRLRGKLARQAVLIAVGPALGSSSDLTLTTSLPVWARAGMRGDGHLSGRRIQLDVTGRRNGRPRRAVIWLPDPNGRISIAAPTDGQLLRPELDANYRSPVALSR